MAYESAYTGQQIDESVRRVLSGEAVGPAGADGKDGAPGPQGEPGKDGAPGPKGDPGDTPYIGENGNWWTGETDTGVSASGGSGTSGVTSFNGRAGAVAPKAGDYTADMVGARPDSWMPSASDVGAATPDEVNTALENKVDKNVLTDFLYSTQVNTVAVITQSEYDSLTKSDKILYLIKET